MKHLAAYLLLTLGGNESPSAKDISSVLSAVGIEADEERTKTLLSELKGKDINEVRPQTIPGALGDGYAFLCSSDTTLRDARSAQESVDLQSILRLHTDPREETEC